MARERLRLLKALGWLGFIGVTTIFLFVLVTVYLGIQSIANDDDKLATWVGFPALAALLIAMLLNVAMERKRRQ